MPFYEIGCFTDINDEVFAAFFDFIVQFFRADRKIKLLSEKFFRFFGCFCGCFDHTSKIVIKIKWKA